MLVSRLMNSKILTVKPKTPLPEVWRIIFKEHVHGLPVVDNKNKLIGIISAEDLLTKLFPEYDESFDIDSAFASDEDETIKEKLKKLEKLTAENIMNKHVLYTRPNTSLMRALSRMIVRKVRQLPVIDENDRLVGIISKTDIFKGLFKKR